MRLTQPPPRTEKELSLIPLINVVFLLLIFFMLAGTITPSDPLQVEPPGSKQGRSAKRETPQLLLDAQGRIALDGALVAPGELKARLRALIAAHDSSAVAGQPALDVDDASTAPLILSVKADGAVISSQLRPLLAELKALGIEQVQLLVRQD